MYLSELLGALRRRWWLVALGLIATSGLVVAAQVLVPAQQEIHASVLVLPPQSTSKDVGNPFLALGGLQPAADVLARAMNSGTVQDELTPRTGTAQYTVARDSGSSGPIVLVVATDTTASGASALLDRVMARIPSEFAELQSATGVTGTASMTVTPLARDTQPTASTKSQLRVMILAAVGGLAVTVFGTAFIDGLVLRRRVVSRQRRGRDAAAAVPTEPAPRVAAEHAPATVPASQWELDLDPDANPSTLRAPEHAAFTARRPGRGGGEGPADA